jgi:hypothetical protein
MDLLVIDESMSNSDLKSKPGKPIEHIMSEIGPILVIASKKVYSPHKIIPSILI